MKKNLFLKTIMALSVWTISMYSLQAQDCECKSVFEKAVKAYEENYSLFMYKVTDENRTLYNAHKAAIRDKADKTVDLNDCKTILEQYLTFFRDGHTYIIASGQKEVYNENININEKQFKNTYKANNYNLNPIFGIWKSGSYTVAIVPNTSESDRSRDYVGVILSSDNPNWEQTEVKFELTLGTGGTYECNYLMSDHSISKFTAKLINKSSLKVEGLGEWKKVWPEVKQQQSKNKIQSKFNEFHLTYIDNIPYLRLPDFYSVEPSFLDSLLQSNHNKIINSDFMIVDVRGNSGGNDGTYFPVLPYVLNGPIELPVNGFWLSEYNTEMIIAAMAANQGLSVEEYAVQEKKTYESFISNKGTAYFKNPNKHWTFQADTLYEGPKKVIILTDEGTASSGETFVYRANKSEKVVVYGQNTAGVVDGFNGIYQDIGCFQVVFPSSFRATDIKENPIDPYGIAPDVYVNEKDDVLSYAIEHMKHLIESEKIE
ncbi:S41 family peptidase [Marivirga salinae]|uniref:S41 family peptidase n=1 Tax=Marivirga salinarum TaxID=3059078 RepID=A0AA51RED5_9BACT|nr:S41 family peptidase [Marivirga sp. BDSF4-3]WMN12239.1 S41 family peptidase [Marivirga sp. BDSF4-3]